MTVHQVLNTVHRVLTSEQGPVGALEFLRSHEQEHANEPEYHSALGYLYRMTGDEDSAEKAFERAKELERERSRSQTTIVNNDQTSTENPYAQLLTSPDGTTNHTPVQHQRAMQYQAPMQHQPNVQYQIPVQQQAPMGYQIPVQQHPIAPVPGSQMVSTYDDYEARDPSSSSRPGSSKGSKRRELFGVLDSLKKKAERLVRPKRNSHGRQRREREVLRALPERHPQTYSRGLGHAVTSGPSVSNLMGRMRSLRSIGDNIVTSMGDDPSSNTASSSNKRRRSVGSCRTHTDRHMHDRDEDEDGNDRRREEYRAANPQLNGQVHSSSNAGNGTMQNGGWGSAGYTQRQASSSIPGTTNNYKLQHATEPATGAQNVYEERGGHRAGGPYQEKQRHMHQVTLDSQFTDLMIDTSHQETQVCEETSLMQRKDGGRTYADKASSLSPSNRKAHNESRFAKFCKALGTRGPRPSHKNSSQLTPSSMEGSTGEGLNDSDNDTIKSISPQRGFGKPMHLVAQSQPTNVMQMVALSSTLGLEEERVEDQDLSTFSLSLSDSEIDVASDAGESYCSAVLLSQGEESDQESCLSSLTDDHSEDETSSIDVPAPYSSDESCGVSVDGDLEDSDEENDLMAEDWFSIMAQGVEAEVEAAEAQVGAEPEYGEESSQATPAVTQAAALSEQHDTIEAATGIDNVGGGPRLADVLENDAGSDAFIIDDQSAPVLVVSDTEEGDFGIRDTFIRNVNSLLVNSESIQQALVDDDGGDHESMGMLSVLHEVPSDEEYDSDDSENGLDAEYIEEIAPKEILTQNSPKTRDSCVICHESFGSKEIRSLPCSDKHCYHAECIDRWLHTNTTCPNCRIDLRTGKPGGNDGSEYALYPDIL